MRNNETPYHRRRSHFLQRSRERRGDRQANQYISVDRFLCTFETVYNEYFQTHITVRYKSGWYYIGQEHLHKSDLVRLLEKMLVCLHTEMLEPQQPQEDL